MEAAIQERYLYIDIEDKEREHFDPDSFLFGLVRIKTWSDLLDFVSIHKGFFFDGSFEQQDVLDSASEVNSVDLPVNNLRGNLLKTLSKRPDFDYLDKMFLDDAGVMNNAVAVYDLKRLMEFKRFVTLLMQYISIANGTRDSYSILNYDSYFMDGHIIDLVFSRIPSCFLSDVPGAKGFIADQQLFRANDELRATINKTPMLIPDGGKQLNIMKQKLDECETANNILSLNDEWNDVKARYEDEIPYIKYGSIMTLFNSSGRLADDVFTHIRKQDDKNAHCDVVKRQIAGEIVELVFRSLDRGQPQEINFVEGNFYRHTNLHYRDDLYECLEKAAVDNKISLCAQCGLPVKRRRSAAYCSASCRTLANKGRREKAILYAASGASLDEAISAIGNEYESSIKRWYEEVLGTNPAR